MKPRNFNKILVFLIVFLLGWQCGYPLSHHPILDHGNKLASNKVFENYNDMPFYPGYKPIKSRYRLLFPRFKEIDMKITQNKPIIKESQNSTLKNIEIIEENREILNNSNISIQRKSSDLKGNDISIENINNSSQKPPFSLPLFKYPLKTPCFSIQNQTLEKSNFTLNNRSNIPIFQEIHEEVPSSYISDEMSEKTGFSVWSSLGKILTFHELGSKFSDINDYYQKYVKTFSSDIQSNRELKNLLIFSLGILGLISIIIFRNCCLEPMNMRISNLLAKTEDPNKPLEKFLLQGRKILKNGNSPNEIPKKNESAESSSSSDGNGNNLSKVLKELSLPDEKEKLTIIPQEISYKFGSIFNHQEAKIIGENGIDNMNKEALYEEQEESINIDIESFIRELDNNKEREEAEILRKNKDFEEEKKARRLSYLVNNHIIEETLITRCLKPSNEKENKENNVK